MIFLDELTDYVNVLSHIDGYVEGLGLNTASIDQDKIESVVRNMRFEFPAQGGHKNASVFKKVSNFFCYFITERPILNPFPDSIVGDEIAQIKNHQNVMVAFDISIACLHNATVQRHDGDVTLSNKISMSKHSYTDLIQACANVAPNSHFHIMSVFFEQLSYKFNPEASYPLMG